MEEILKKFEKVINKKLDLMIEGPSAALPSASQLESMLEVVKMYRNFKTETEKTYADNPAKSVHTADIPTEIH